MGLSERKLRHQQEVKNQIIASSREIVNMEGWAALSIRKIADAIEYSVPVVYKHFESKEAITAFFVAEGFAALKKEMEACVVPTDPIEKRVQQLAEGYWLFASKNPKDYELMFGVGLPTCEMHQQVPAIAELANYLRQFIDELIESSGKKDLNTCVKYRSFWSILHGVVAIELLTINRWDSVCPSEVLADSIQAFTQSIQKN
ncbi:TetR/AcrR family transcriptional regulator [Sphingobacterium hotanense]|uniref:TetR/AcrR family transcriptional regulator n=1 Tax=Sphingobacterium hotanense TaxID=649196 RepID=UPI0011F0B018|nr:TetR/AcrR family transcriptional regulator [Sphingobacterium hotanense]